MPLVSRRVSRAVMFTALLALGVLAAAPVSSQAPQAPGRASALVNFVSPGPNDRALVTAAGGRIRFAYTIVPAVAADVPEAAYRRWPPGPCSTACTSRTTAGAALTWDEITPANGFVK